MEGTRVIPGSSTIHFDEISRKRIYEIELLNRLLQYQKAGSRFGVGLLDAWRAVLREEYQFNPDAVAAGNVLNVLTNEFLAGSGKKTYGGCVFIHVGARYSKAKNAAAHIE